MAEARDGLLFDGPEDAGLTLVLAHGAGAPMDARFMNVWAEALGERGFRVVRFEFAYMRARHEGRRPGPDREAVLLQSCRDVVASLGDTSRIAIGGKSMGGRMASMIADELGVAGLLCLGYPFHPPGRAEKTRTAHLESLRTPALIVQGERDHFGTPEDVAGYRLSPAIRIHWLPDGDHDFKPRAASGRTQLANWREGIEAAAVFLGGLKAAGA